MNEEAALRAGLVQSMNKKRCNVAEAWDPMAVPVADYSTIRPAPA